MSQYITYYCFLKLPSSFIDDFLAMMRESTINSSIAISLHPKPINTAWYASVRLTIAICIAIIFTTITVAVATTTPPPTPVVYVAVSLEVVVVAVNDDDACIRLEIQHFALYKIAAFPEDSSPKVNWESCNNILST